MEVKVAEFLTKNGLNGALIIAIIWLNNKISTVEDKLYNCLEDRPKIEYRNEFQNNNRQSRKDLHIRPELVAVLPSKEKETNYKRKK